MSINKKGIILLGGILLVGLILFSTIFISLAGTGNDCSSCVGCTDCYIGINSTEEAQLFNELDGIVKNYIAEKENITDQSNIQTYIIFKSRNESFVTVDVNEKTWNGTWLYSNGEWNPGEDFQSH
ncbi:hypothetical protein [Methanobacterium petrolearium]|uniref:hypothetical protein n=1 Tax=Methanobacterium petrolearium TaxID=710190 RepID=UPI001AE6A67A|nr:hypothetical protein [Methanobacterium petrolearium]MBP1946955.1 Na+-transporting NADH:ubiquinone oxidoreductase subunit NqrF [Methanobacterium petrolearium]